MKEKKSLKYLAIIVPIVIVLLFIAYQVFSYFMGGSTIFNFIRTPNARYVNKNIITPYEKIISFSDKTSGRIQFQNLNSHVAIVYYKLEWNPSGKTKMPGYPAIETKSISYTLISWDEFTKLLTDISDYLDVSFTFDEFRRIKYGGEHLDVTHEQIGTILGMIIKYF